jgi:hypothetical protein
MQPVSFEYEAEWTPEASGRFGGEKNAFPLEFKSLEGSKYKEHYLSQRFYIIKERTYPAYRYISFVFICLSNSMEHSPS